MKALKAKKVMVFPVLPKGTSIMSSYFSGRDPKL
eukprot:CAMPEP_0206432748 /NCGR_PEP_ID=MMETSP0324_2-20121206/8138_1 /ASSEMBLY_ACC=CAM_ASM_000836 /TAXON_ID=2866 /ORGANISM="Crypthecodinium cohnii, Strain Seligo" /LENGTH=33 /DNA_ID= /DNA_START= /DNA_END= /DNA_ORIENTATION=